MYKPAGIVACVFVILLISTSGCSFLSTAPKPAAKQGTAGDHAVIETPTLPDQYTARGPQAGSRNPAQPVAVTTKGQKPVLRSAAQTRINGTGLGGSINETNAQIVSYLTQDQDYSNKTIVNLEIIFWNDIAKMVQRKMDFTNPTTITYAQNTVTPLNSGVYSVNQTCDLWDNTLKRWIPFVNTTATTWDEDFQYASETVSLGLKGDCDDFAILLASSNIVLGGNSRVVYAINSAKPNEAHMYAEAQYDNLSFIPVIQSRYVMPNTSAVYYHPGNWLNLDWFDWPNTATHPGGKFYGDTSMIWVMYQGGTWEKLQKNGNNWTVVLRGP